MIKVKPIGGLCNRMRVVDSAVTLSKNLGVPLTVRWESNEELNCRYSDLFQPNSFFKIEESGFYTDGHPMRIWTKLLSIQTIGKVLGRAQYGTVLYDSDFSSMDKEFLIEFLTHKRRIGIFACSSFQPEDSLSGNFIPAERMKCKIDCVAAGIGPDTIGIHIRRTDNVKSIEYSPLELFVEAIGAEISRNDNANFFLATDSPEVEATLCNTFAGRIVTYKKELSRKSEKGIQDALVDLFCLSRTKKIYGSYWSSFSETAAALSGIELTRLVSMDLEG